MKEKNKRKIPPITQNDEAESGAAALCMILASYGRYVDLSEMRKACHVSRDGCRIDNLIAAAESYGMKADAVRCEASLEGIKLPVIALWKQDHWLVVEERTEKGIRLVDPAYGKRRVSEEEFAECFSFQVISLEPTSDFVKGGKPYKLTDSIREMMQGSRSVFLYLTLLCFLLNMVGLMLPGMTRLFVDFYLPSLSTVKVGRYFLVFLMLLALQAFLLYLKKRIDLKFQRLQSAVMTRDVIRKILSLPLRYFQTRSHSTIISQMTGIDAMADFVSARLVPVTFGLVFSVLYIILLFYFNVKVASWTVGVIMATIVFLMTLVAMSQAAAVRTAQDQAAFYGAVTQNTRLFDTVKSVALEDSAFAETMSRFSAWQHDKQAANSTLAIVQAVPVTLPLIIQTLVMGIGGREVIRGTMSIGEVLACQSIAMSIFAPIVTFVQEFAVLQFQKGPMKGLHDMLAEESDPRLVQLGEGRRMEPHAETPALKGDVELKDISFGYDESAPPILEHISVRVPAGHSVAFAGASGSGKSTVMKLLLGLYHPWEGEILLDGMAMDTLDRTAVAVGMAVVSQSPFVFSGTVRDNITLFDRSISMEAVTQAAREACVFEAIEAHPGGFNAPIGPSEKTFSGGEIQRIMIARALVRNPSVLLMDEATSALDTVVEEQIMENIRARGITTLIVAHRLSTIRDSDEIIVLQKGRIAERGTHEELLKTESGIYRELISAGETDNG